MANGKRQWGMPTQPAPTAPTPEPTPQQITDPYTRPDGDATVARNADGSVQIEQDRSLLGVYSITGQI